jgi:transcriptional regulator with XRE-family HTH domain
MPAPPRKALFVKKSTKGLPGRRDPFLIAVGGRVRHLREVRGWTQEAFARRADVDRSYVAGIETGMRNPSIKAVAKIARGLGITLATLFDTVA